MNFDEIENILNHLDEDPMRIILTEHFLEQTEKRNIPDTCLQDLLEKNRLIEIKKVEDHPQRYELTFSLDDSGKLIIIADTYNRRGVILISAFSKTGGVKADPGSLELECIYDFAFDLMSIESKHGFRYLRTIEMEKGFNIDFDSCEHPAAIEIIRPSKKFGLASKYFSNVAIEGVIEISSDSIMVHVELSHDIEQGKTRVLEKEVPNVCGIKPGRFAFKPIRVKTEWES